MSAGGIRRRVRSRLLEQRRLARSLLGLREQIRGSLFVRYGMCGKTSCACRQGRKHGPYYVLSRRSGGEGSFAYLAKGKIKVARDLLEGARAFKRGLRRLTKVNSELLALLRRYQEAASRKGGYRLGIASDSK